MGAPPTVRRPRRMMRGGPPPKYPGGWGAPAGEMAVGPDPVGAYSRMNAAMREVAASYAKGARLREGQPPRSLDPVPASGSLTYPGVAGTRASVQNDPPQIADAAAGLANQAADVADALLRMVNQISDANAATYVAPIQSTGNAAIDSASHDAILRDVVAAIRSAGHLDVLHDVPTPERFLRHLATTGILKTASLDDQPRALAEPD
jgi:hypothetical protein